MKIYVFGPFFGHQNGGLFSPSQSRGQPNGFYDLHNFYQKRDAKSEGKCHFTEGNRRKVDFTLD